MGDSTFRLLTAGQCVGTVNRYERAWVWFGEFVMAYGLSGRPISMRGGMDCLTHLFELGLQWRAFGVLRSAVSRTLPPSPGGVAFGG